MQKSYLKNIFRTIDASIGRYFALICIVMLGVIFYVGLKITTDDMIDTANDYYNESNLYDFSLVSTIGFETEDIFELREKENLLYAEGSYFQDMIVSDEDSTDEEYVVRIHSLTDNINAPVLIDGRLPQKPDECVVDARHYDSSYIGKKIIVSAANTEETLDNIVYKELLITGTVDSPLYLSYQRGTTGIGNGSISAFILVDYDFFGIDYYTQIFVDIEDGYYIFSDEYKDLISSNTELMESYSEEFAQARYDRLESELNKAKNDYSSAVEDYEEGLSKYEDEVLKYEDALALNNKLKSQLAEDSAKLEELKQLRQEYLYAYRYNAAKQLLPQINELESTVQMLEGMIDVADEKLLASADSLEEVKATLESALAEIEENSYIMDKNLGKLSSYALTRDDNIGYSSYKENADIVASIAYIFPLFFVMVAGLVCMTTMSRMIEEERTQIGVFKALGYSKSKVYAKYIFYSLSAAVIGVFLGFYIGSYLFPTVIWYAYMIMYSYTDSLNIIFDYSLLTVSMITAVIVLVGSTVFTCHKVLSEQPAEMIRPKAPEPGKRVFLEKIKFIWNRLPFLHKVSIRNCFRYKKRFFMMLMGIAGCTALLVIGFGIQDSISSICNDQYDRIETYDYLISADVDLSDDELNSLKSNLGNSTTGILNVSMDSADASYNETAKEISIISCGSFDELEGFLNLRDDSGTRVTADNADECVLTQNLADSLGISVGDSLTLSFDNLQQHSYTVTGIYENYIRNYVVLTKEAYEKGSGEEAYMNCFFAKVEDGTDTYEKLAEISGIENVSSVSVTQVTREYFDKIMKSLNAIVLLVIVCAAVLAFVVLYNLNNINIMERVREIATIKVLGFLKSETVQYVFRENLILTLLGTVCGLPLGYVMHRVVMSKIKVDMLCFDVHVEVSSYLISAGFTILFSVFVELFMRRKISGVNMSESLKSIE